MNSSRTIISILVFLGVSSIGAYGTFLYESIWKNEQKRHINQVTDAQASAIERRLAQSLSSTYILAVEVRFKNGDLSNFESFAEETINALGGISNLQLAPNGVIHKIHPLAGNEKAIGHNLLQDDKRRKEAHQAIQERKLTLAGPFETIQGGVAVIGRNPIFLNDNGEEKFWGFASAFIYLDDLLDVTDLAELETKGYNYELSRTHPDSGKWEVFAQSKKPLSNINVTYPINVPNSNWKLTLSRPLPERPLNVTEGLAVSMLIAAVLSLLVTYILREPERLRAVVNEKTAQLNELAFYDVLTGLMNRRLFMEQLELEFKNIQRSDRKAALMYLDLDDFKKINDSLGHNAGDQLLVGVAKRLKANVRDSDIIGRLGGDEYAILLRNINEVEDCQQIADKMIRDVSSEMVITGTPVNVGLSIGITVFPDDSTSVQEILKHADLALYASKDKGKNLASFFNQSMQQSASSRLILEQELKTALINKEFELFFQPIVRVENHQVVMLEALLRWNHPQKGLVVPAQFIEVAEQCGLIKEIGKWVIEQACLTIKQAIENNQPVVPMAINLSTKQLTCINFSAHVEQVLAEHEVDPAMIEFEITESALMENLNDAIVHLDKLRQLGCRFSIDDFGTGYSSLSQLKQLPVDMIKIDRSFIQDTEHDHQDRQIVQAIIAMSHYLGLSVVAEGVETEQQMSFVQKANCEFAQGYFFSKPKPYNQLKEQQLLE